MCKIIWKYVGHVVYAMKESSEVTVSSLLKLKATISIWAPQMNKYVYSDKNVAGTV